MDGSVAADRADTRLRLNVFGGFALLDSTGRTVPIVNRKACGLLAYLALRPNVSESRERLAGLFWSDRAEDQARASLRQCLKHLRSVFDEVGFAGFRTERQEVLLSGDLLDIDLHDVTAKLAQGEIADTLVTSDSAPEKILYGFENLDDSFAAWLYVTRQKWQERLVNSLQALMKREDLDTETSRRAAEALLAIDPTHEEAHRHLIRHYADLGNTAAALKQYKAVWDLLEEEYDTEPADETQALIAEIKAGTYEPAVATPVRSEVTSGALVVSGGTAVSRAKTGAQPRLPIIGIAKFARGGPWSQQDYLIDGFRRELAAALIRFREWIVVEGGALALSDVDSASDPSSSHRAADYQLEGVYYEQDDTIHQIITLKDISTHRYIWSERLTLTLDNWFAARQEIVRRISVALNIYISVERLTRIAGRPAISLDIYERWLQGQALGFEWRPEADDQAAEIFRSIIDQVPGFAPAYSSLVQVENTRHLVSPGLFRSAERQANALALSKAAVQMDPVDTKTQLSLAWSHVMNENYDQAILSYRLAYELNQNDPWTIVSVAMGLAFCAVYPEAKDLAGQALRLSLNPSPSHWLYQSNVSFLCGDLEACVEAGEKAGAITHGCIAWRAAALALLGRTEEARTVAHEFLKSARANWRGQGPPDDAVIGDWILDAYPIRDRNAWERLKSGLMAAGVPSSR